LEKQSTNNFSYSEQFDNGFWTPIASSITANNTTSPDGTQNAEKLTEDATNSIHSFYNTNAVVVAATTTASIFYKKGTRRYFSIKLQVGTSSYTQVFDADAVTTGSNSSNGLTSVSTSIVSMGNGWVRASVTGTDPSAGTSNYMICSLSNSATPSFDPNNFNPIYTGTGTDYGYVYGAQLEASSYPTSYIPTTSSSATRIVDTYQKAGIGNTSTAGTLYYELIATNISSSNGVYLIQLFVGSIVGGPAYSEANSISIVANGNQIQGYNNLYTRLLFTITPTIGSTVKIAIRYNGTNVVAFVDGTKQTVYADTSVGVKNALRVNNGEAGSQATKELIFFPTDLTDAECIALTTL
jgi:hypothetical protein